MSEEQAPAVDKITDEERALLRRWYERTEYDAEKARIGGEAIGMLHRKLLKALERAEELEAQALRYRNGLGKVHTMASLRRDEAPPGWRKDRLKTIADHVIKVLKGSAA